MSDEKQTKNEREFKAVTTYLRVLGVFFLVLGLFNIFNISQYLRWISLGDIFVLSGVLGIVAATLNFVAGMLIMMFAGERGKANVLAGFSIVVLVMVAVNLVVSCLIYGMLQTDFSWLSFLSLILPALFLAGAMKHKDLA